MLDNLEPSEVPNPVFPENRFEAVEEIMRLLGLAPDDFALVVRLLHKSCYGDINFEFGDVSVSLSSNGINAWGEDNVTLSFELAHDNFSRSVKYRFKPSDLGVHRKSEE